jgi:transcriptional regulator with XRE-family HTH domain
MNGPGHKLRLLREQLGYTLRDVEQSSAELAERLGNEEYAIPLSRLSDMETKHVVPSVYRMYSLAAIYRLDFHELMTWYGIELSRLPNDVTQSEPRRTHRIEALDTSSMVDIPVRFDPSFDLRRTANLGRMIEKWGLVPLSQLRSLSDKDFTYGYIGSEDYTMYPLLLPGCFVQVDESKNEVVDGVWRSEYERPIYFVETRTGYICCWCSVKGDCIILQPHPLSPVPVRMMRYRQEAEVIGQVVGIAMRLDQLSAPVAQPDNKVPARLN